MNKHFGKKLLSILLALCLVLSVLPLTALASQDTEGNGAERSAACEHGHIHDESCGGVTHGDNCTYLCQGCADALQALVDALPAMAEVAADKDAVTQQMNVIDAAKAKVSDATRGAVNWKNYENAAFVLATPPDYFGFALEKRYEVGAEETPAVRFAFINDAGESADLWTLSGGMHTVVGEETSAISNGGTAYYYLPADTYTVSEIVDGEWDMTLTVDGAEKADASFTGEAGQFYTMLVGNHHARPEYSGAPATIDPTIPNGNNGWYTSARLIAPEYYTISLEEYGSYSESVQIPDGTYNEDNPLVYYLRDDYTIYAPITYTDADGTAATVKVDGAAPVYNGSDKIAADADGKAVVTVTDDLSGMDKDRIINTCSEDLTVTEALSEDGKTLTLTITGLRADTSYPLDLMVYDMAGNELDLSKKASLEGPCGHSGGVAGNRCDNCSAELAASVTSDGTTRHYTTLEAAAAAVNQADYSILTLLMNVSGDITLSKQVVVYGGNYTLSGSITFAGKGIVSALQDITIKGDTPVTVDGAILSIQCASEMVDLQGTTADITLIGNAKIRYPLNNAPSEPYTVKRTPMPEIGDEPVMIGGLSNSFTDPVLESADPLYTVYEENKNLYLTHKIGSLEIRLGDTVAADGEAEYNGEAAEITITDHQGKELIEGTDYDLTWKKGDKNVGAPSEIGTYRYTVAGKGEYSSVSLNDTLTITPIMLTDDDVTVTFDQDRFTYDGNEHIPTVTVKLGGKTLVQGQYGEACDYYVARPYSCTDVGTYAMTVVFCGKYSHPYNIVKQYFIDPAQPQMTWEDQFTTTYDGSPAVVSEPIVELENSEVFSGEITYSYTGDSSGTGLPVDAGTYTVTASVEAEGNYAAASVSAKLTVLPMPIAVTVTVAEGEYVYNGDPHEPAVTVLSGQINLNDSMYAVGYSNNVNAGTATVTITDAAGDNFKISGSATFTIGKAVPVITVPVGITAIYGQKLEDVVLSASAGDIPGTWKWDDPAKEVGSVGTRSFSATFTPDDTANYLKVTKEVAVTVKPRDISHMTVSAVADQVYNGEEITPTVSVDGLTEGTDYTVSYKDNVNAGTAAVIISGTGNYGGTKDVSFTIQPGMPTAVQVTVEGEYTYNGKAITPTVIVKDGDKVIPASEYTVSSADVNAGTATVTVIDKDGGNYKVPKTDAKFTVAPARLILTADDKSAAIGSEAPALTYTVIGLMGEDKLLTEPALTYGVTPDMNCVGTTEILISGADAGSNYIIEYVRGKLTVHDPVIQVQVDMTEISLADKTYDGKALTYTGSAKGNHDVKFTYKWLDVSGNPVDAPVNAGTYRLRAEVDSYGYMSYGEKTVTIAKAQITVAADHLTAEVGAEMPELTYTVSGLAAGDQLRKEPALSCNAVMTVAGEYAITVYGAEVPDNVNYESAVKYAEGRLTVAASVTDPDNGTPDSGDNSGRILLWLILLIASAAAAGYLLYRKRKEN